MAHAELNGGRGWNPWRIARWSVAGLLLLAPLVAMRFTGEVVWGVEDFIFAGVMIGGAGLAYELAVRARGGAAYRAGCAVALGAAFVTIWINAAVGIIGTEGDPANLIFAAMIAIALGGAVVARFRPAGMARAMSATAIAQAATAVIALSAELPAFVLSAFLLALWILAAALFRKAAEGAAP